MGKKCDFYIALGEAEECWLVAAFCSKLSGQEHELSETRRGFLPSRMCAHEGRTDDEMTRRNKNHENET
jgi:hypothetical protein